MHRVVIVQHGEKERLPGDPGLTSLGRRQAATTATWLREHEDRVAIWSSPLRRAVETASPIVAAFAIEPTTDDRFRERMNWDGSVPFETFLEDWAATTADRDHQPQIGDSSNVAASRFLAGLDDAVAAVEPGSTIVVVAHGGVTTDVLRTVAGDGALRSLAPTVIDDGVPSCAITGLRRQDGRWHLDRPPTTDHLAALG